MDLKQDLDSSNERIEREEKQSEANHKETKHWIDDLQAKLNAYDPQIAALKKQLSLLDERVK